MCDNKGNDKSNGRPSSLAQILPEARKQGSKIFILTPETLASLGIASHAKIKARTPEAAKNIQSDVPIAGAPSKVIAEKFKAPDGSELKISSSTNKAIKRKRDSVSDKAVKSSIADPSALEKRVTPTHNNKSSITNGANEKDSIGHPPKIKKIRRSNCSTNLEKDESRETQDKDTTNKDTNDSKVAAIGVRTSRRVVKPKKFDDYILLDDAVDKVSMNENHKNKSFPVTQRSRKSLETAHKTNSAVGLAKNIVKQQDGCSTLNSGEKHQLEKNEEKKEKKPNEITKGTKKKASSTRKTETSVTETTTRCETTITDLYEGRNSGEQVMADSEKNNKTSRTEETKSSRHVNFETNSTNLNNDRVVNSTKINVVNEKSGKMRAGSKEKKKTIPGHSAASSQQQAKDVSQTQIAKSCKKSQTKDETLEKSVTSKVEQIPSDKTESSFTKPVTSETRKNTTKKKEQSTVQNKMSDSPDPKIPLVVQTSSRTIEQSKIQISDVRSLRQETEEILKSDGPKELHKESKCSKNVRPKSRNSDLSMSHLPRSPGDKAICEKQKSTTSNNEHKAGNSKQTATISQENNVKSSIPVVDTGSLSVSNVRSVRNDNGKSNHQKQDKTKILGKIDLAPTNKLPAGEKTKVIESIHLEASGSRNEVAPSKANSLISPDEKEAVLHKLDLQDSTDKNRDIAFRTAAAPSPHTNKVDTAKLATPRSKSKKKIIAKINTPKPDDKNEDILFTPDKPTSSCKNAIVRAKPHDPIIPDEKETIVSTSDQLDSTDKTEVFVPKIVKTQPERKNNRRVSNSETTRFQEKSKVIQSALETSSCTDKSEIVTLQPGTPSVGVENTVNSMAENSKYTDNSKTVKPKLVTSRSSGVNKAMAMKTKRSNSLNQDGAVSAKTATEASPDKNETKTFEVFVVKPKLVTSRSSGVNKTMRMKTKRSNSLNQDGVMRAKIATEASPDKNETKTSKPDTLKVPDKNVAICSTRKTLEIQDKHELISTPDATPTSTHKKRAILSKLDTSTLPNKKELVDAMFAVQSVAQHESSSAGLDDSTPSNAEDIWKSLNLMRNEIKKSTQISNDSPTPNIPAESPSDYKIGENLSLNSSAIEIAEETIAIEEKSPVRDATVAEPEVRVPRKKGRPRKTQMPIEASSQVVVDLQTDNPVTTSCVNNATVETTGRTKKPVQRNVDETDGKGLSDGSDDGSNEEIVLTRRRGRPAGIVSCSRKRGRGRLRGRGRGRIDFEYIPREQPTREGKPEKPDTTEESQQSKVPLPPGEEVECGKCKEKMAKKSWAPHNLKTHNDMGWLSGQPEPDFANNEQLLRTVLFAAVRKKNRKGFFTCETCGDEKRSAHGFISHLQFCGKSENEKKALLVMCPICGTARMPSSVEMHERFHRQMDEDKVESLKEPIVIPGPSRGKRKAAEKAATKITEFTELIKEDQAPQKKRRRTNAELFQLIDKPGQTKKLPSCWRGIWKAELRENGKAKCRQPGCVFYGDSIESMLEHNSKCPHTPRVKYVCKICQFSHENRKEVLKHARLNHAEGNALQVDSDFEQVDSTDSEDYDSEQSGNKPQRKSVIERSNAPLRSITNVKFLDEEMNLDSKRSCSYLPAIRWTMEFECKNYRLKLFQDLSPNPFKLLGNDDALGYLPELETSMRMKHKTRSMKKEPEEWANWQRFQGRVIDGTPMFFTGGPVWALAWLTVPAPLYDRKVNQYIAVSTHPTMESVYSVGKSHVEKNLIQIWNLGYLNHRSDTPRTDPQLSYGIAHDKGTIWCLEWCPSGCYEHSSFFNDDETKMQRKGLKRMGLLAAACSDGCVHIFSLPFPEDLNFSNADESSRVPIYETKPVVTLVVSTAMYDNNEQTWQCTKLNWNKELGHDTIIAGFSNGYIAMWDITSESPLLVTKRDETTMIDAFHHFFAHGHAVSLIQFIPVGNKRFFISGSYDRFTKIWDREDTSCPLSSVKKGIVTDGSWFMHWPGFVTSHDDIVSNRTLHGQTYFMSLRHPSIKSFLMLPNNSTTYSVDISDYGNSVGHGTMAGEVLVIFPHLLWNLRDMDRDLPRKRWLASTAQVVDFSKIDTEKEKSSKSSGTKNNETQYVYMPETYEECKNRFGIVFHDNLTRLKRDLSEKTVKPPCSERLNAVNVEEYPFASINRISWNPNSWSYLWLCVGYQNGMVRCLNFNAAARDEYLNKLLPPHAESMLNESRIILEADTKKEQREISLNVNASHMNDSHPNG